MGFTSELRSTRPRLNSSGFVCEPCCVSHYKRSDDDVLQHTDTVRDRRSIRQQTTQAPCHMTRDEASGFGFDIKQTGLLQLSARRTTVVNGRATADSPELVRRHRHVNWRGWRSSTGCRCTTASSWLCWCSKHTLASVLYTSEMPWRWRVRTVGTVCALPTSPTTSFYEREQSSRREYSVFLMD